MALIGLSEDSLSRRKRMADAMIARGVDTSPVQHWSQGAARLASVLAGKHQMGQAEAEERGQSDRLLQAMLGGGAPSSAPSGEFMEPMRLAPPSSFSPSDTGGSSFRDRIAGIESGGNYSALGPVTDSGDRAYGKYQVMGANIPAWTKAHLGVSMSPQDFLKSPEAQDAVFDGQFGQYVERHGPDGAARAWFAGEGGMNDMDRKDVLGTSVADYSQKFAQAAPQTMTDAPPIQIPPQVQQRIGQLWQAGPQGQQMAMQLYAQHSKPPARPTPTDDMREYQMAQRQGYEGSFMDYMTDMRKAGATNVTVGGGKFGTIPQGYQLVETPEGAVMRPVPGSPAAKEIETQAQQAKQRRAAVERTGDIVLDDIGRSLNLIESADFPVTGMVGAMTEAVPGTPAHDLSQMLATVKGNIGFDKLQAMREASPTGGALGQVSNLEIGLLQATFGALAQSQTKEQLVYNLQRLRDTYLDIIHGPGNRPTQKQSGSALPDGVTEEDIEHTMKVHSLTREQVMERLGNAP